MMQGMPASESVSFTKLSIGTGTGPRIGVQKGLCRTFGDAAYVAQIMRAWSMSIFPRPYIWRLTSLSLVIWPSV